MLIQSSLDDSVSSLLMGGCIGVLATDTLYGVVCRAADPQAVTRLYELKNREAKPGTVIAANPEQLIQLGLHTQHIESAAVYWPGPTSVLIPADGANLTYLTQGLPELACRVVAETSELVKLLEATGPLLTSSANQPGETPAATIDEAQRYFGESVDFYIDDGDKSNAMPSTLVRLRAGKLQVLRHGAGTIEPKEKS